MRRLLFILSLVLLTVAVRPAGAQLRQDAVLNPAPTKLYDQGGAGFSLNRFFDPQHFQMSHSFELSSGSFGGYGSSMAMYTNTMAWQFSQKLAARVDLAMAYSPTANMPGASMTGGSNSQVFLRNAEIAYRPTKNMMLHLSVRQNPFGYYASPYGMYDQGYRSGYQGYGMMGESTGASLFWNSRAN